ncbi:MAG: tetratricopeptide repeat protein [Deltaproteobacteria bacterium]|nr:tetratricopeptide repeat protein [Deltaproteobacteria bacterium]
MDEPVKAENRKTLFLALIPALITFIIYLPALKNGFAGVWDDQFYIIDNPHIREISSRFFTWAFLSAYYGNWHPLTTIVNAVEFHFFGLEPFGYHLVNNLLHSIDTFLVFLLGYRLITLASSKGRGPLIGAFVASLLFGLHPLHVESVAWVSELKDVLCALFYLLAILSYLKYASQEAGAFYFLTIASFILALFSKPMAVSLPPVLLILDLYPLKRLSLKSLIEKAPLFFLSAVSSALTVRAQGSGESIVALEAHTIIERVSTAVNGYAFYIYKLALPANLSPFYPLPAGEGLLNPVFMASFLIFVFITVLSIALLKRSKAFLASWLFFVVTLLPVIGIVQVGGQAAADRYMYIPSLAPFVLMGSWAGDAFEAWNGRIRVLPAIVAVAVLSILSFLTFRQTSFWKGPIELWSRAIEVYSERVPIAYYHRGIAYRETGRYNEAAADFGHVIDVLPRMPEAYYNRALANSEMKDHKAAIDDLTRAIVLNPDYTDAYNNRGAAYFRLGAYEQAIEDFKTVIQIDPQYSTAYQNLGLVYSKMGNAGEGAYYMERGREVENR